MTIHSLERTDDARVVSGLLARSVLSYLDDSTGRDKTTLPLKNLFRLLEMYRYDEFSSYRPKQGVLQRQPYTLSRRTTQSCRSGLSSLGEALKAAHKEAFGNQERSEVVDTIERVLTALLGDNGEPTDTPPDATQRDKTVMFLRALSRRVQSAD